MEILAAYDLTGSYRATSQLTACSPNTVTSLVTKRNNGMLKASGPARRTRITDPYMPKIEEWVEQSRAKIRSDVAHRKLLALGYTGSDRSTRRALKEIKDAYEHGKRRVYRPWIPEPGMWAQFDWGWGPEIVGRRTNLFCAWLAWSRTRIVIPTWDRTIPTIVGCLDQAMRSFGGAPTYWLTDNERTITMDHVAGVPVRHPEIVAMGGHYGITVATCNPRDPESKGGSEATVKIAKADLVPTEHNLLPEYGSWAELAAACEAFNLRVNTREHRVTRRPPFVMLVEEQQRLHPLPSTPYAVVFGQTRKVTSTATISHAGVAYSVPHGLVGETVWVRIQGNEVVVTHMARGGAAEVARHPESAPGHPQILDAHYPPRPAGPLNRVPKARSGAEAEFLALGPGAGLWLTEAAAAGTYRLRAKMVDALTLSRLHPPERLDWALGQAAAFGRFAEGDLVSILDHHPAQGRNSAGEDHSLQHRTTTWEGFGQ